MNKNIDYSVISEVWKNEDFDTKFKMFQKVVLIKTGEVFFIKGINRQDSDSVEYALHDYSFLVYEEELSEYHYV